MLGRIRLRCNGKLGLLPMCCVFHLCVELAVKSLAPFSTTEEAKRQNILSLNVTVQQVLTVECSLALRVGTPEKGLGVVVQLMASSRRLVCHRQLDRG